ALAGEAEPEAPGVEERIALARRHARLLSEREGKNIVRMRKHAMWYMAGIPGAAAAREKINACVSVEDFDVVFDELVACAREHAAGV
ncbi:tRNA-dihydrouridine synthase, partial [Eggerthella sinensis]